jgi:hypothetical protein
VSETVIAFASYVFLVPTNVTAISSLDVPKLVPVIVNNPLYVGLIVLCSKLSNIILLPVSTVKEEESVTVFELNSNTISPLAIVGVITTICLFVIDIGVTVTPPIFNVKTLSKFLGNPVPVIVTVVPPSGDAEFGVTEVIVRPISYPVTVPETKEYPILTL